MIAKKMVDCAQDHVVGVSKRAVSGGDELTGVEKPLVEVSQVREELSVDCVELLGERAAEVSNILMDGSFMAVWR